MDERNSDSLVMSTNFTEGNDSALTTGGRTGAISLATLGFATDGAQPPGKKSKAIQTNHRARCGDTSDGHSQFSGAVLVVEAATFVLVSAAAGATDATGRSTPGAPGRCNGWITMD